jgi:hypothetical protein
VPALDRLPGLRVVAEPAAIDGALWAGPGPITVLRLAPDDALGLGATGVEVDDPHAIVEDERGFVGGWWVVDDLRPHIEWALPTDRPALAQGSVAGVPAKVWLPGNDTEPDGDPRDERALVVTAAAYADVLADRSGWGR